MLKYGQAQLLKPVVRLFNIIFSQGIFPDKWCKGYINPIFKKGDKEDPSNYRGITINSCLGKLFTKILNNRLSKFLTDNKIIKDEQIGFTKNKRTTDHMFVLKTLVESHTMKGSKPLYTCFVDFKSAFDTVWHEGLLYKLRKSGVSDKFYNIIKNMYSKTEVSVKVGNQLTEFFKSNIGVRQGDNLSPTLFKIFVNDFIDSLDDTCDPVKLDKSPLSCLFYADDLVLMSKSITGLQNCLNILENYCGNWKLKINIKKTKCLTFNTLGRIPKNCTWNINGQKIENVKSYTYLGLTFSASGSFTEAKMHIQQKGLKAYFKFFKAFNDQRPSIKTFLHTFDHTVKSVLLYGAEIWGSFCPTKLKNQHTFYKLCNDISIEKMNIKACKYILGVNRYSTNAAVMSELGRFPLFFSIIISMIKYWYRLENSNDQLLRNAYDMNKSMYRKGKNCWTSCIYKILEFLDIKEEYILKKKNKIKPIILSKITLIYKNIWRHELFNDQRKNPLQKNKLRTFRLFKNNFSYETYLDVINFKQRNIFCKFRIGSHNLEIETGRHKDIPENERKCKLCKEEIEDEIHFLLKCPKLKEYRDPFIKIFYEGFPNLAQCNKTDLFIWLMSCEDKSVIYKVCNLLELLFFKRSEILQNIK